MESEVWKPILGYEGLYDVSDQGRIRRVARSYQTSNGVTRNLTERVMKPFMNYGGYWRVKIANKDGVKANVTLHRAVCEAFYGPRPEGMVIRHMDGDINHNALSNLQYGTQLENMQDKVDHGTNNVDKLGEEKAEEIRELYSKWRLSVPTIAEQFGVSISTINRIIDGKTYQNVSTEYCEEDFM
jgi:DNA-binding transcriptional regulator YiaG